MKSRKINSNLYIYAKTYRLLKPVLFSTINIGRFLVLVKYGITAHDKMSFVCDSVWNYVVPYKCVIVLIGIIACGCKIKEFM